MNTFFSHPQRNPENLKVRLDADAWHAGCKGMLARLGIGHWHRLSAKNKETSTVKRKSSERERGLERHDGESEEERR